MVADRGRYVARLVTPQAALPCANRCAVADCWLLGWSSAAARGGRRCPRKSLRFWPTLGVPLRNDGQQVARRWAAMHAAGVRRCGVLVARKRAGRATLRAGSCAAVRIFRVAAAAPAMLWRCFGDVVTAGLNSSRVWFGPVPGSP
ncbi:hypothetical protein F511_46091 [Dorcoceras hygrometricum]|uniref:Uncharacterized protein n=1 Tax=Dorcoceras hygrometricum TaxID=472368 RepID=A0A2Z7A1E1_9LAMI|nr:hypothetical protein F511_46091 [Dorcoceras hygrometricum]